MTHARAVAVLLLCLSISPAAASEFDDYRIPESSWRRYDLSLGGNATRFSRNPNGSYSRGGSWNGQFGGGFSLGRDSDPLQWDAGFGGDLFGLVRGETRGEYNPMAFGGPPGWTYASTQRSTDRLLREAWHLSAGARWYPSAARVGLELRGSTSGDYEQIWDADDSESRSTSPGTAYNTKTQNSRVTWTYREAAEVRAMAGFGRVRDASPVFLAQLLEERLDRDRRLQRPLTRQGRERLAGLLSLRDDFMGVHSVSEKFFWAEVERVLREDGALVAEGLDAYAAQHAAEGLNVAGGAFVRRAGWFVGPALSARHSHELSRSDVAISSRSDDEVNPPVSSIFRTGTRRTSSDEALLAGGRAEFHRPLGTRLQFDLAAEALVEVAGDDGLQVAGEARLQRLIGERWFAEAHAFNVRLIQEGSFLNSSWNVGTGGAVTYFLEDFCGIKLSVDRFEGVNEGAPSILFLPPREHHIDLIARLSVSLGRGRLDAPGLVPPVRPMH